MHEKKSGMDRSKIIDTLKQRGGFITTGEVKSRGEYEQLRRAIEDGTLMKTERLCGFVMVFMWKCLRWQIT